MSGAGCSCDRYFLERVTDHVLAFADAKLAFLPGGVDEYLELRESGKAGKPVPASAGVPEGQPQEAPRRPAATRQGPPAGLSAGLSAGQLREARKELARLDRQLERLTGRESELHKALAEAAADYGRLIELGDELRLVNEQQAALEDRWLELVELTGR